MTNGLRSALNTSQIIRIFLGILPISNNMADSDQSRQKDYEKRQNVNLNDSKGRIIVEITAIILHALLRKSYRMDLQGLK